MTPKQMYEDKDGWYYIGKDGQTYRFDLYGKLLCQSTNDALKLANKIRY